MDLTDFVAAQRLHARDADLSRLRTPAERVYLPGSARAREQVGITIVPDG